LFIIMKWKEKMHKNFVNYVYACLKYHAHKMLSVFMWNEIIINKHLNGYFTSKQTFKKSNFFE
jgi:hypothetical protein